jgi:hypothetical protein
MQNLFGGREMTKPKATQLYAYTNPHPEGIKSRSDCVYRALAIATGKDWLTIYDELTALGRELLSPPNDDYTYKAYLDKIGKRVQVPGVMTGKRPTGKHVARMDSSKTYVVRMAGHLVCVKGGKIRDTWNCGDKAAYITWELN